MDDTTMNELKDHLDAYCGIRDADSEDAWFERYEAELDEAIRSEYELIEYHGEVPLEFVDPEKRIKELMADPHTYGVLQSRYAEVLLLQGVHVDEAIQTHLNILDVGCEIGALTTFYARNQSRNITGVDVSGLAIEQARKIAKDRNIRNVTYRCHDFREGELSEQFDVIACTRDFEYLEPYPVQIPAMLASLNPTGRFIMIPKFSSKKEGRQLVQIVEKSGWSLAEFRWMYPRHMSQFQVSQPIWVFEHDIEETIDLKVGYREGLITHNLQTLILIWVTVQNKTIQVQSIVKDSPADRSEMEIGDVILEVNGRPIWKISGHRWSSIHKDSPEVTLTIQRGNQQFTITIPTTTKGGE